MKIYGAGSIDDIRKCTELDLSAQPNPFNATVTIRYAVPDAGDVRIDVFNAAGQRVRTLVNGSASVGVHTVSWDSRDNSGRTVSSGAYFCRLITPTRALTQRIVLAR